MSPKRRRSSKRRTVQRRPINVLASLMTVFSLYFGVSSIFASFAGEYEHAARFILVAIIFDMFDGTVARMTKSVSEFGKELDSLCDLVSFGVAPAVLIYIGYIREAHGMSPFMDRVGSTVAIIFAICGALRLARFNVYQSQQRDYFTGLPIPAAGGTVAAFALFTQYFDIQVAFWLLGPLTLLLSYLMVSSVRYPKDKLKIFILAPRHAFRFLALYCVIGIAIFHFARKYSPAIIPFPLAAAYVTYGMVDWVYHHLMRLRRGIRRSGQELEEGGEEAPGGVPR